MAYGRIVHKLLIVKGLGEPGFRKSLIISVLQHYSTPLRREGDKQTTLFTPQLIHFQILKNPFARKNTKTNERALVINKTGFWSSRGFVARARIIPLGKLI